MALDNSLPVEQLKEIIKRLDRIERRLNETPSTKTRKRETFVNCSTIQERTGWKGREQMRWARNNGLVDFHKRKKKYILESIHPYYLIPLGT